MDNLGLTYTGEMEKAMQQNHGIGFAEYERKLNNRLQIEREREKSYKQASRVVNEMERKVHR
ncbi:hypothetical protein GCM10011351_22300 [Paraliobacillus quinghaiensis]|uniref:Uncharacterized protein n=1 Tax=Paraliobacillus quinghaiensis TaxID=470815 RepID=A0A917TTS3_9BACI|nr:hypothetical protein [Paraliobacillus quinghaiensis]GGM35765.1 hypothetical protein GCM10011351_22300 [Paraliobacillus quinghaiensis]